MIHKPVPSVLRFAVERRCKHKFLRVKLTQKAVLLMLPLAYPMIGEKLGRDLALKAYAELTKAGWPTSPALVWGSLEMGCDPINHEKYNYLRLTHSGEQLMDVMPPDEERDNSKLVVEPTAEQTRQLFLNADLRN